MGQTIDFTKLTIFGIRHLSPAGAYHLLRVLNEKKPACVLIEGPVDATRLLPFFANAKLKLPVAILAYTTELPVHTVLYPFARYSPEYQAIRWAQANKADVRFIDLPSAQSVFLHRKKENAATADEQRAYYSLHSDIYDKAASLGGEDDYESYWERHFEHNLMPGSYQHSVSKQSTIMREMTWSLENQALPIATAYNTVRESFMKNQIAKAIADGYRPEQIVVVCGAYHVSGLTSDLSLLTEEDLANIPAPRTQLTLMPYSNFRLSSRSGYGAGNMAPAYYDLMFACMEENRPEGLAATYLTKLGKLIREAGGIASTANVIESVRLANALAALHEGSLPTLKDLHDAAVACLGHGDLTEVAEAFARLDIGTAIGELPDGVEQTPVQDDMTRQLQRLKLTKYKTNAWLELDLDLRENRRVKSEQAAFIDLERSNFLNRLQLLQIGFAKHIPLTQAGATWAEKWHLRWTPETEIELVETNLKGETIEVAASYQLKEQLANAKDVLACTKLIGVAYQCNLPGSLDDGLKALQQLVVDAGDFVETALAARQLAVLTQYGDLRRVDTSCLIPLLQQLFLRGSLLLCDAAGCNDEAAKSHSEAISAMHTISQEQYEHVDDETWLKSLQELARRDDKNARLSGLAFSLLLERSIITEEQCAKEISRRLCPAVPPELGAGWFEGLAGGNRYALLSRHYLWRELDNYLQSLTEQEFFRSVVFLRRAFSHFNPAQKNSLAELLGDLWNINALDAAEALQSDLSPEQEDTISELNDFDFEDLI